MTRRAWNQAVFASIHVSERKICGVEYAEPFQALFSPGSSNGPMVVIGGHYPNRSSASPLVEVRGFEPLSSSDLPGLLRA